MMRRFPNEQKNLIIAGGISLAVLAVLAIVAIFDSTQILGINRWIKPIKFLISITIYLWTLAVFLHFISGFEQAKKIIEKGVILMMFGELVLVIMQAGRGTTSHFNIAKPFDGAVFAAMGLMILANTFLIGYLLFLYFKAEINLPKSILWGMRLGIIVFLLGSIEGGYMSSQIGHAVGVADGGAGLPLVNWSTEGGDLRAAHFFGLHAIQIIPIVSYLSEKLKLRASTGITFVFALVYFAFFSFLLVQALNGQPFLSKLF